MFKEACSLANCPGQRKIYGTFRADWENWNDREREAIREAATSFKPEWILPEGKFSEWHYMILSRERSGLARSAHSHLRRTLAESGTTARARGRLAASPQPGAALRSGGARRAP